LLQRVFGHLTQSESLPAPLAVLAALCGRWPLPSRPTLGQDLPRVPITED
jgi:hypothetical protein